MERSDIGLIGLAVMGQNLVRNMLAHGYRVTVYNRSEERTRAFAAAHPHPGMTAVYDLPALVNSLVPPRRVMLMVQAGSAVDAVLDALVPLLSPGDIVIDGGNSHYTDTIRRVAALEARGLKMLGTGVSGGEEGALKGPSIMPGGSRGAWEAVGDLLKDISAHVDGTPCCDYIGPNGAGHFVKTTHNGIEYGDMQLICEAYFLMQRLLGLSAPQMAEIFSRWNQGELDSYLIEITADILATMDPRTGEPLVDRILDTAGQKGTGKWTSQSALDLGVAAPTVAEAVFARCMSAVKEQRTAAQGRLPGPDASPAPDAASFLEDLRQALYAAKICSYAQGFALMAAASEEFHWDLKLGDIALMWRGGCIIRARFLGRIKEAYDRDPALQNLMLDPFFTQQIIKAQAGWRRVVASAALQGVAVPCFSSALGYYDAYRTARLPANLIQAQRDYFGAHTYERVDEPRGRFFHTQWLSENNKEE